MRRLSILVPALALAGLATDAAAKKMPAPEPDKSFPNSPIADWTQTPKESKEPTFTPPAAKRLKLANGMALLVVENHKLPIASMVLVVPNAGSASDPTGKYGLASFTGDMLDEGAGGLSAIAIAEESDRLGANIGVGVDSDAAYVSTSTLSKTLDASTELMTKIIMQPAFDAKEFDRVKGDRGTSLELRRDRPREVAQIMLDGTLFGADTAYGHPEMGTRADFGSITVDDVKGFYAQHWNPAAMTLVVAGDVDAKALKAKLDAGIGAWKVKGAKPSKVVANAAKWTNRLLIADRKDAAQSDVRIGIIGIDRKDPKYAQFEVFRTVLGDGFTSRLVQRLREQLGITYGIRANMDYRLQKGPFVISSAIVTPSTGQGIGEILHIIDDLGTTDLPAEELEKGKQNIIRALPALFDTNAGTAGAYADLALHGLPDNWFAKYAAQVRTVTAKQVKAIAKSTAPSGKLVISVVGDLTKIKAEVDKLSLGDAVMFDLYGVPVAK
ncbi:MAG TPA: pitrilysin family protein [Kofleriaceae bacterium]|jgi:predicted Zn-dependent peptidase